MKRVRDLSIATKLLGGFFLVALIAGIVGYEGVVSLNDVAASDALLYENNTIPIALAGEISTFFQRIRVNTREIVIANDRDEISRFADRIQSYRDSIDILAADFEKRILSDRMKQAFAAFAQSRKDYAADLTELVTLARQNRDAQAMDLLQGSAAKTARAEMNAIQALVDLKQEDAAARMHENADQSSSAATTMIVLVVVGVLVSLSLGFAISRSISGPVKKLTAAAQRMAAGDVTITLDQKASRDEIGQLFSSFKEMVSSIQSQAEAAERIARGDLAIDVVPRSEVDTLNHALKNAVTALRGLVAEAGMLSKAAVEGKLATRGNAEKFQGGYREIVQGVNDTLDSVIGPLNVAAEYVDRISKGDIPAKITDSYNGDFNEIKNNLNQAIGAVNALVADASMLSRAAVEGKLATRADASKHGGDFRKIVQGVNDTLDSVIGPLNVAAEYVDRISKGDIPAKITDNYNGDFNEIKNNLNQAIDAVSMLVADAHMLSRAAVEGKLATRADASKHGGDFRKIVQGVNDTLDAVIGPLNVAAEYVDR